MTEQYSNNLNNSLKKINIEKLELKNYNNIYTIFYTIKKFNNIPYILFLFQKNSSKSLELPTFSKNLTFNKNFNKIKKQIKNIGNTSLNIIGKQTFDLKGCLESDNDLYLFFDSNHLADIYTYKINDKMYWCSLYEIINYKKCLKYKFINENIQFFLKHIDLFLFKNKESDVLPIPMQIYLELTKKTNVFQLLNNYDETKNKNIIEHKNNIKKNKKIIRSLLFDSEKDIEIYGKKIYYNNSNHFIIISIFD